MCGASDVQRAGGRTQLCPQDGASDRQEPGQGPRRSNIIIRHRNLVINYDVGTGPAITL